MTKRTRATCSTSALLALLLWLPLSAGGLEAPSPLLRLEPEDREALETLATHDAEVREAALRAAQHANILVEARRIQARSSEHFRERIDSLPEDLRKQVWEIVRVPGLLEALGTQSPPSAASLDALAARHGAALGPTIRSLGRNHHDLLAEILRIDEAAWERFEALLEDLPEADQQALRALVDQPELLTLLAHRIRLSVYLGDSYRDDPQGTLRHLSALATEVARREANAEEAWASALEEDEDAARELEQASRVYAAEYGYDYDDLTDCEAGATPRTVIHRYPYWLGYPSSYANHFLFPYGYWYDFPISLGFYYDGGHRHRHLRHHAHGGHGRRHRVHYGMPSRHFLHWYFGRHHDRHYGSLSHRFHRHHDRHRHARGRHYSVLSHWKKHRRYRDQYGDWHRPHRPRGERHDGRPRGERQREDRQDHAGGLAFDRGERRERRAERRAERRERRTERRAERREARDERRAERRDRRAERRETRDERTRERGFVPGERNGAPVLRRTQREAKLEQITERRSSRRANDEGQGTTRSRREARPARSAQKAERRREVQSRKAKQAKARKSRSSAPKASRAKPSAPSQSRRQKSSARAERRAAKLRSGGKKKSRRGNGR